jgi:hypothetical protein
MPVILESGSDDIRKWLDPDCKEWSNDLQSLLRPYQGNLDIYPVKKEVGKVGNNSPSFIRPLNSKENKSNIANFFPPESKKNGKNYAESIDIRASNAGLKRHISPAREEENSNKKRK